MAGPSVSNGELGLIGITVPERGFTDIDKTTWERLQSSIHFRRLHSEGMIEVAYRPHGRVRLKGTCYVGRVIFDDVVLDLSEKVEGALQALLGYASSGAFQLLKAPGASAATTGLLALLIEQFLEVLRRYTSRGREFKYESQLMLGSLAGGRLHMTRTIQVRSRGLGHLLSFERGAITFNTSLNRVIYRTLSEVEQLAKLVNLPKSDLASARSFSILYADCRDHETMFRTRAFFAEQANFVGESKGSESVRDMMALAGVILSRESFDTSNEAVGILPRAWFLNLENLFESAVRKVLQGVFAASTVSRGSELKRRIFDQQSRIYKAHPDIVISVAGQVCVGDVKYKDCEGSPAASDVYQLLAHAEAFDATTAFLLFPAEAYAEKLMGTTRRGTAVHFFWVRISHLVEDLTSAMTALGALPPVTDIAPESLITP